MHRLQQLLNPSLRRLNPTKRVLNHQLLLLPRRSVSRYTERNPGTGRTLRRRPVSQGNDRTPNAASQETGPIEEKSPLWEASQDLPAGDPQEGLKRILECDTLVITRQIEMMNLFLGFEQANRYAINSQSGEVLGYIAEEQRSFLSVMSRQLFRTHRPFRALVMDAEGTPLLWLRRPFAWINSRMFVQRQKDYPEYTSEVDRVLDTFAEVQQRWHLWRRRYDLFLRDKPHPIVSRITDAQPEPDIDSDIFRQFARVDMGFWAWHFILRDVQGEEIASISRSFRGFAREIFTDTGQYVIRFYPAPVEDPQHAGKASVIRTLHLDEKALILALAVNIDFDYFSRHSESGHGGLWLGTWE